jgi:hypothetical protein
MPGIYAYWQTDCFIVGAELDHVNPWSIYLHLGKFTVYLRSKKYPKLRGD